MSTTTYARPLHAVPDFPSTTKAKFAALLDLREAARRAFDKAMLVPRSALRWPVNLFDRWVDATASLDDHRRRVVMTNARTRARDIRSGARRD